MRKSLLFIAILNATFMLAQTGNTISAAISLEGTVSDLNILGLVSTTVSGLTPSCASTADVFYKHTPTWGDNKVTVSMVSTGISLLATVDYQILKASNGILII